MDPYDEEDWENDNNRDNINNNNNDDVLFEKNAFKFIVGRVPRNWGWIAQIGALAIDLVDNAGYVIDWNVSGYYPELMDIEDFDEQSEGEFEYNGDLTIEKLINRLNQMGFNCRTWQSRTKFSNTGIKIFNVIYLKKI